MGKKTRASRGCVSPSVWQRTELLKYSRYSTFSSVSSPMSTKLPACNVLPTSTDLNKTINDEDNKIQQFQTIVLLYFNAQYLFKHISQGRKLLQTVTVKGSPKLLQFILWGPWMLVPSFIAILPMVVEICQSGKPSGCHCNSGANNKFTWKHQQT